MTASVRAEWLRLLKWPVTWVVLGLWSGMNLFFAYLLTYLTYRSAVADGTSQLAQTLLDDMMPTNLPATLVQGMPMFGGALILILSALATGSGYSWMTWKTVFTQGPGRLTTFAGTLVVLCFIAGMFVLTTLLVDVAASLTVTAAESRPVAWPWLTDLGKGVGAAFLITLTFTLGGALLGVAARSPALSVGLGLVWILVVENLLRGVGALLAALEAVTDVLPGTAAGSLAGALGAVGEGIDAPNGTPGVLTTLNGGSASFLLLTYSVVFIAVMAAVVRRRDT
jgi:ABC-2 type transport system permease protein